MFPSLQDVTDVPRFLVNQQSTCDNFQHKYPNDVSGSFVCIGDEILFLSAVELIPHTGRPSSDFIVPVNSEHQSFRSECCTLLPKPHYRGWHKSLCSNSAWAFELLDGTNYNRGCCAQSGWVEVENYTGSSNKVRKIAARTPQKLNASWENICNVQQWFTNTTDEL